MTIDQPIWLSSAACVSLAPGIRVGAASLTDENGESFPLNASAAALCRLAQRPIEIRHLAAVLVPHTHLSQQAMTEQVSSFFADLSRRGLVSVSQSAVVEAVTWLNVFPALVLAHRGRLRTVFSSPFPARHYPASLLGLLHACVEGHRVLLWGGPAASVLALAVVPSALLPTLNGLFASTKIAVALVALSYALLIFLATLGHELGHYATARLLAVPVISVYARHGAAGVLFRTPSMTRKALVLLAGPTCGLLLVGVACLFTLLGLNPQDWVSLGVDQLQLSWYAAAGTVGCLQLLYLTPLFKDGRELIRTIGAILRLRAGLHQGGSR